jgi:hypothetical protein
MSIYYSGWQEEDRSCEGCGWRGKGKECRKGETFRDLFEICCPICGHDVGVIDFPTFEEVRANAEKADPADLLQVEIRESRWEAFLKRCLRSTDQLPDTDGESLSLVWDTEGEGLSADTAIKHGDRAIWRETAFYEHTERFEAVAVVLAEKYGPRLRDLIPTRGAICMICGDKGYFGVVADARLRLFGDTVRGHPFTIGGRDGMTVAEARQLF